MCPTPRSASEVASAAHRGQWNTGGQITQKVSLKPGEGVGETQNALATYKPLHQAAGGIVMNNRRQKATISGVLDTAISWTVIGPPKKALRQL